MCDFSGRLVTWMDGELAENEAAVVEQHVRACEQCRKRVTAYQQVSSEFATYHSAMTRTASAAITTHRRLPRWVPVLAAAAAAMVLLLVSLPRSAKPIPVAPPVVVMHPPITVEPATTPLRPVQRRHVAARRKAPSATWAMADPAIQIVIPADAMFPPGAVPEGATYVANLSLTAGSVQAIRLQP